MHQVGSDARVLVRVDFTAGIATLKQQKWLFGGYLRRATQLPRDGA